jgi:hypothetical protein
MSRNYYLEIPACHTCGRGEEMLEIGTHGGGRFTLKAHRLHGLTTWKEWKAFLQGGYGEITHAYVDPTPTVDELIALVERLNGEEEKTLADIYPDRYTRDPQGFTIQRS